VEVDADDDEEYVEYTDENGVTKKIRKKKGGGNWEEKVSKE